MRGLFFTLFCFGCIFFTKAQTSHELGIFLGMSNYIGDVGEYNYINPKNPAYGIIYKWNAHPRFALRGSLIFTKLEGDDDESTLPSRTNRGLSFENNIAELNAGFEFNFFPYEPTDFDTQTTPYIASGLSYFFMDNLRYTSQPGHAEINSISSMRKKGDISIPLIVGVKSNFARTVQLGFEVGARYTLSENLDGSRVGYDGYGFGNLESNDWYFFTGIVATFIIGSKNNKCRCPNYRS